MGRERAWRAAAGRLAAILGRPRSAGPPALRGVVWKAGSPAAQDPENIRLIVFSKHELEVNNVGMFDSLLF